MGLTPLEGLVMGTRSGDLDPAVVLHLLRSTELGVDDIDALLNKRSGVFGLSGRQDMRDLEQAVADGDTDAATALEVYCYRLRKYIGAYTAALGRVDAIAFTAGVGRIRQWCVLSPCRILGCSASNSIRSPMSRRGRPPARSAPPTRR